MKKFCIYLLATFFTISLAAYTGALLALATVEAQNTSEEQGNQTHTLAISPDGYGRYLIVNTDVGMEASKVEFEL